MNTQQSPVSTSRAILIYCAVSLFLFFEMALQVSPSVMAPELMHHFNIGIVGLGLMSSVYFYTYTFMQIPAGMLFDRFDPRRIIVSALAFCVLGTLLFTGAHTVIMGSIARLLIGFGSAFAFVAVLVITNDLFKNRYFAAMTGVTQLLAALGAMSGQLPISLLMNHLGWQTSLQVLAGIGILLMILTTVLLNYQKNPKVITLEKPEKTAHFTTILANPQTWVIALYACFLWTPMSCFASLWGVSFLMAQDHLTKTEAAFLCSMMWLGLAIASPILGIISTHYQNRVIPLAISAALGVMSFGLVIFYVLPPIYIASLLFLAGAACAGQALSFSVVKENNLNYQAGTAIAINNMAVVVSGAIFQPLTGQSITLIWYAYLAATVLSIFFIRQNFKNVDLIH